MLTAKQIADIIRTELTGSDSATMAARYEAAAEKIAALCDDNGATVAAVALENEVTSTLMDMTVATVLATLIEEEGGGRSNVSISPMSMDHMQQQYTYDVRNEGLIRHVSIQLREDSNLRDESKWREPSNRHSLLPLEPSEVGPMYPVTRNTREPKEYDRPVWAIRNSKGSLHRVGSREAGETLLRDAKSAASTFLRKNFASDPLSVLENRYCLHPDCPTTGCNISSEPQDVPEATSEPDSD